MGGMMTEEIKENYYELQRKLLEFEYRFREIKDCNTLNLLILEIKSFIFGNEFLHGEYKKQLQEFLEQKNTPEFQKKF